MYKKAQRSKVADNNLTTLGHKLSNPDYLRQRWVVADPFEGLKIFVRMDYYIFLKVMKMRLTIGTFRTIFRYEKIDNELKLIDMI